MKRTELDLFIETNTVMHLFASKQLFVALHMENADGSKSVFFIHCEQNLCSLDQSLVRNPNSSSGAVWSRYLYFNQRSAKNNNQNVSEPFISLGINKLLGLCVGSISAKMFQIDGKLIPEFVFARRNNSLLAQLASATLVSGQMDDADLEFLPAYHAPELAEAHGQGHREGLSWTLLAGPDFDQLLADAAHVQTAARVRSLFLDRYNIEEKQRVGMSSDGEVLSGCHWQGCGSMRSSSRCREALDNEAEIELALVELNYEYENSLAAEVTSKSHLYLDLSGGAELLKLWRAHPGICNVNSPLAYSYPSLLIARMLAIPSPEIPYAIENAERATWSIIHAVHQAGYECCDMCKALAKCVAFLAVCQVNRNSLGDTAFAHKDVLIPSSIVRLEESLAVSVGDHDSTTVLYATRAFVPEEEACPVCSSKISDYKSKYYFQKHVNDCHAE